MGKNMGRIYRLAKQITEEEAAEVLRELREVDGVEEADITEDRSMLKVKTADELYPSVMSKAVNICRRVARGTDLSFVRFDY